MSSNLNPGSLPINYCGEFGESDVKFCVKSLEEVTINEPRPCSHLPGGQTPPVTSLSIPTIKASKKTGEDTKVTYSRTVWVGVELDGPNIKALWLGDANANECFREPVNLNLDAFATIDAAIDAILDTISGLSGAIVSFIKGIFLPLQDLISKAIEEILEEILRNIFFLIIGILFLLALFLEFYPGLTPGSSPS